MAVINEVTGQTLVSKYSELYRSNYDSIFKRVDATLECSHSYPEKSFSEVYPKATATGFSKDPRVLRLGPLSPVCTLCGYVNKEQVIQ